MKIIYQSAVAGANLLCCGLLVEQYQAQRCQRAWVISGQDLGDNWVSEGQEVTEQADLHHGWSIPPPLWHLTETEELFLQLTQLCSHKECFDKSFILLISLYNSSSLAGKNHWFSEKNLPILAVSMQPLLTCRPSWPTLVCPLTTVRISSSRRLSSVKQSSIITDILYSQEDKKIYEHFRYKLTKSWDGFCLLRHQY